MPDRRPDLLRELGEAGTFGAADQAKSVAVRQGPGQVGAVRSGPGQVRSGLRTGPRVMHLAVEQPGPPALDQTDFVRTLEPAERPADPVSASVTQELDDSLRRMELEPAPAGPVRSGGIRTGPAVRSGGIRTGPALSWI